MGPGRRPLRFALPEVFAWLQLVHSGRHNMPTEASQRALDGLRDLSTIQWYVIPLLAIVLYIYAVESKKARESGNWDAVFAALTVLFSESSVVNNRRPSSAVGSLSRRDFTSNSA